MTQSFYQLTLMNWRLIYRNRTGLFFTLVMPVLIYVGLSVLPIDRFAGANVEYSEFVLPGIVALTIMQGGIYGLAYFIIDLKARGVIKRFLVTPISQAEFLGSLLLSRAIVAVLQLFLLGVIGWYFFNTTLGVNIFLAVVFALIGAAIFSVFGLLISTFADTYEAAAPITTAVGLPLTFLGNVFFPVESLPNFLQIIGKLLPITYLASGMRTLFMSVIDWQLVIKDLGILLIWLVVVVILALWLFKLKE